MPEHIDRNAIVARFHGYGCPRERWRIGAEFERILVHADGTPVSYDEPQGIRWLLEQLCARFGWSPVLEDGRPIALLRDGASTTLEPGGQVELSGAPMDTLHQVAEEAWTSIGELQSITHDTDIHLVALGLTPLVDIDDIPWVPKGRYRIMREYLPQYGELAHTMMKGTSSFQANYDFADEADCAAKLEAMSGLGPLTTAIFANSPLLAGKETGYASYRGHVWTRTDPARTGFPEMLRRGYRHDAWVDYLLDVPMMFFKGASGAWENAAGRSFRMWMDKGFDGHFPTWEDWSLHETSVFPEVRVKRTIEIRGADACPLPIALGGIALWTGLMYDPQALDEAVQLSREFVASGPTDESFATACRAGLAGDVGGRSLGAWARDAVAIAAGGLARSRPTERAMLEPVEALAAHGESPAIAVCRIFKEAGASAEFLTRVRY